MKGHIKKSGHSPRGARTVVGVRELKANASSILRQVRESRTSFIVTHRGTAVGVILPLERPAEEAPSLDIDDATAWANFLEAGRRVARRSRPGVSGVQILSSMRR
jgi:prevent-host-death family protein